MPNSDCSLWNKLHTFIWLWLVNDEIDKESFDDIDTLLFIVILYVITNQ
jgi:hypothetical protein